MFSLTSACDYRGKMNVTSSGKCNCKDLVDGELCSKCLQGHWNLRQDNPEGCESKYF